MTTSRGEQCSQQAYGRALCTFANRHGRTGEPTAELGATFAQVIHVGQERIAITTDGIGTKFEVAERLGHFATLGFDLMAMVVDDLVAVGAEPVAITNVLDVDRLDPRFIDALMAGLQAAAQQARVAVVGGELAELGSRVGGHGAGPHANWSATAIGVLAAGRALLDGRQVIPGDDVVVLREVGLRSNGFTRAREILHATHGDAWHTAPCDRDASWGERLLTPSTIYCRAVVAALEAGCPLHAIAHVTGGGLLAKLARVLRPTGLGAHCAALFEPAPWVRALQQHGAVDDSQAYATWNMGNGMALVVPPAATARLVEVLTSQGVAAQRAGAVVAEPQLTLGTAANPTAVVRPLHGAS